MSCTGIGLPRSYMLCYRAAGATTRCVIVARRDSTTLHALGSAKCNRTNWGTRVLIVNEKGGSHRPQTPRDRGVGRCSHAGGVAHRTGGTHRPFSLRLYPLFLRSSVRISVGPWPLSKDGTSNVLVVFLVNARYPAMHHNSSHAPSNAHEPLPSFTPAPCVF